MLNKRPTTDEEAEEEAAEARRRGTELIENHLSHHMEQNPDSDYVTWIATLHPENATVTIDERFFVPGNPWWTVYETSPKQDIPIVTAVPVSDGDEESPNRQHQQQQQGESTRRPSWLTDDIKTPDFGTTSASSGHERLPVPTPNEKHPHPCNPLDFLIGCMLSLSAILTVFALELTALLVYSIAAFFWNLVQGLGSSNVVTGFFYSIFMVIYWTLAIADSSLLLASVLTAELVAIVAWITSCLFAGCSTAARWHQYIRRNCHLIRCSFRSKVFSHPPRQLCCNAEVAKDEEEDHHPPDTNATNQVIEHSRKNNRNETYQYSNTTLPTAPPQADDDIDIVVVPENDVILEGKTATYGQDR